MEENTLIKLYAFSLRSGIASKIPEPDLESWRTVTEIHNKIIRELTDKMTKKSIETAMQKEYDKGIHSYNQLMDGINLLYRNGLVTEKEMEIVRAYNHKLSQKAK